MSDSSFSTITPYLQQAQNAGSPQVYLNPGYQAHLMGPEGLVPMEDKPDVLTAEQTDAILKECCSADEIARFEAEEKCDTIIESPAGPQHVYFYKQESGTLVLTLSLHVDHFMHFTRLAQASDLHLPAGSAPNMRKNGQLQVIWEGAPILTREDSEYIVKSFLTDAQWEVLKKRGDVDFAYENADGRYRSSVVDQRLGYSSSFRLINDRIMTMEEINLPTQHIVPLTRYTNGLILVTGAVASGKTTTLSAIIDFINGDRKDHIITLEEPIETVFESKSCQINQREVHKHTESFARALRASLREDPDVIVVGEMRDLETISLALTAAETGHLVLGTLHTGSASRTIDRILDAFPVEEQDHIRIMVSESLRGIMSQQLVPKKDGTGRVMAMELLTNTAAIANCIREGKTFMIPGLIQTGKAQGMRLMDDALQDLYKQGIISGEECISRATDITSMENFIKANPEPAAPTAPVAEA